MSSSYFNLLRFTILAMVVIGCAKRNDWLEVEAMDNGGYTIEMPVSGETKTGTLIIAADTLISHMNIVADSGVTYMASWVDIPARWRELEKGQLVDSLWAGLVMPLAGDRIDRESPLENERPNERGAWYLNEGESVRLVVAVRVVGTRAVLMSAGSAATNTGPRTDRNLVRFLNSFEETGFQ